MVMPFTPCDDVNNCTDTSVEILENIFGDVINKLVIGADAQNVESANILATMFSIYASGIMVVSGFIVTAVVMMSVMNTANDGEVMGKNWSSSYTILRIVSGGGVLIPTASGYSFIQLIVLMFALWGVGFANLTYKTGMAMGVLSPAGIVSKAAMPGTYYGLRDFAKDYMGAMYCVRSANSVYRTASGGSPNVGTKDGNNDRVIKDNNRTDYIFELKDRNTATNLGGGTSICGEVKLTTYTAIAGKDTTESALLALKALSQDVKHEKTVEMMAELAQFVNTWPASINEPGWEGVDTNKFNQIVKKYEDQIAVSLLSLLNSQEGTLDEGMKKYLESLTKGGWASAGGWFQRVGIIRGGVSEVFSEAVGSVSKPRLSGLPRGAQTKTFLNSVTYAPSLITAMANEKLSQSDISDLSTNMGADLIPETWDDSFTISDLNGNFMVKASGFANTLMRSIVDIATGTGSSDGKMLFCGSAGEIGGSINRMKCIGDYIAASYATAIVADTTIKTSIAAAETAAGALATATIFGNSVDGTKVTRAVWKWLEAVPLKWLATLMTYMSTLAFYFGIVIPTFPYTVFMVVVVGWVLAVVQAVVAAPLWAVMHMTPDRTFIGSQTQGYLMLLALFARPALAVLGLFASMLISDPIITYVSKAFFDMHEVVAASTGGVGTLASIVTFFWWLITFGLTLMPILWMIYGLPQALPDEVLRWISAGIGDLGASSAIPQTQSGHTKAEAVIGQHINTRIGHSNRSSGQASNRGGGGGGPSSTPPSGSGGSTRGGAALTTTLSGNNQGITPQ